MRDEVVSSRRTPRPCSPSGALPSTWRPSRPLTTGDDLDLEWKLGQGGHFLPLPKEPAALENILEVSVVDYLLERAESTLGLDVARGTERGYPDLEFTGTALDGAFYGVVDLGGGSASRELRQRLAYDNRRHVLTAPRRRPAT